MSDGIVYVCLVLDVLALSNRTFYCRSDVVYLSAVISPDQTPEEVVGPYLNATLPRGTGNYHTYFQLTLCTSVTVGDWDYQPPFSVPVPVRLRIVPVRRPSARLPEFGDTAAEEAKRVFWNTIGDVGLRCGTPCSSKARARILYLASGRRRELRTRLQLTNGRMK